MKEMGDITILLSSFVGNRDLDFKTLYNNIDQSYTLKILFHIYLVFCSNSHSFYFHFSLIFLSISDSIHKIFIILLNFILF